MIAEIISIGEELLIGQTINSNASWLAGSLNRLGIPVFRITDIGDEPEQILEMLELASGRADLVLVTGGLGPTRDDITKAAICQFFNCRMVKDPIVESDNEEFFRKRGLEMNELNRNQALVPEGARAIRNPYGTAPGLWFERQGKVFVFMPGVPHEMKHMVEDHLAPVLRSRVTDSHIIHRTVMTQGIGESFLAEKISDWEDSLPDPIRLAYLPSPGIVKLRLSAIGPDKALLEKSVNGAVESLHKLIPEYIWGQNDERLEEVIGELLSKAGKSLVTAESCTGGHIAAKITGLPGCSAWFKGSVVAYSNQVKQDLLGVPEEMISRYGAVSREVAEAMATGARERLQADWSVAVSGIAGPDGGTPEKPVGTVWIAVSGGGITQSKLHRFGDTRERNIVRAGVAAMGMLINLLKKQYGG
jgi:nicotinamide-nucleotide amidase